MQPPMRGRWWWALPLRQEEMRHRFLLLIMPLLLIAVAARAQGIRVVRGAITDLNGKPLKSAVIVTQDNEQFRPAQDGSFEIRISTANHSLSFFAKGYTTVTREIDGSFLMVKMDVASNSSG